MATYEETRENKKSSTKKLEHGMSVWGEESTKINFPRGLHIPSSSARQPDKKAAEGSLRDGVVFFPFLPLFANWEGPSLHLSGP